MRHANTAPRPARDALEHVAPHETGERTAFGNAGEELIPYGIKHLGPFEGEGPHTGHVNLFPASASLKSSHHAPESYASSTVGDNLPSLNAMLRPLREHTGSILSKSSMSQLRGKGAAPEVDVSVHSDFASVNFDYSFPESFLNSSNTASSYYIVEAKQDPMGVYLHRPPGGTAPYQIEPVSVELTSSAEGHPAYLVMQATEHIARSNGAGNTSNVAPNASPMRGTSPPKPNTQGAGKGVANPDGINGGLIHSGLARDAFFPNDGSNNRAHSDSGRTGNAPDPERAMRGSVSSWPMLEPHSLMMDDMPFGPGPDTKKALGSVACNKSRGDDVVSLRKCPRPKSILRETSIYDQGALGGLSNHPTRSTSFPNLRPAEDVRPPSLQDHPIFRDKTPGHRVSFENARGPGAPADPVAESIEPAVNGNQPLPAMPGDTPPTALPGDDTDRPHTAPATADQAQEQRGRPTLRSRLSSASMRSA